MKLAGVARFDCVGSTLEFTCYMAGLASRGAHTCGWTTSTLHSHLAWRYWFRWGCGASSTTSFIADLAGATSPIRVLQAQITQRCTRSVAMHPIRRGVMPTDRVHHLIDIKPDHGQFLPTDPNRLHRTPPHGLNMLTPAPNERHCTI